MNLIDKIKRKFRGPQRYKQLYEHIHTLKPTTIMEIGLWNGERACKMIQTAATYHDAADITYYGFDLFESLPPDAHAYEHAKDPLSEYALQNKLEATGATIKLFKGNTNETLPNEINQLPKIDFIYIDGGHSLETIANDWRYCAQLMHDATVVIFDDYWETLEAGAKKIVDELDPELYTAIVLPVHDISNRPERKTISFAAVTKKV